MKDLRKKRKRKKGWLITKKKVLTWKRGVDNYLAF
jgi:hypothetical protein